MLTLKTSDLRKIPIDDLPQVMLLGFLPPNPLIERAVRVGGYLRQLASEQPFQLLIDDGGDPPIGWRYSASRVYYV